MIEKRNKCNKYVFIVCLQEEILFQLSYLQ